MKFSTENVDIQQLADLFKVLGDPTRLRIVSQLLNGKMCVSAIADAIDMGQSAVSHQLRVLRQAHLVTFEKEGKTVQYMLSDDHVVTLLSQGIEHVSHD